MVSSVNPPECGVHLMQRNVQLYEETTFLDSGTLYISEESVFWKGDTKNFAIPYQQVSVHAISKDVNTFPHEHLLIMLDGFTVSDPPPQSENMDGDASDDEEDDSNPTEESKSTILRLVPFNPQALPAMYKAMSDCQALNPDEADQDDSDFEGYADDNDDEEEEDTSTNGHVGCGGDVPEAMDEDQFSAD